MSQVEAAENREVESIARELKENFEALAQLKNLLIELDVRDRYESVPSTIGYSKSRSLTPLCVEVYDLALAVLSYVCFAGQTSWHSRTSEARSSCGTNKIGAIR